METELTYNNHNSCFGVVKNMLDNEKINSSIATITVDEVEYPCFISPMFILFYDDRTGSYNLSFGINKYKIKQVAHYTYMLSLFFYDTIDIFDDHFLDTKSNNLYFGDTAYEKYEQQMYSKNGMCKCPICDRVVYNSMMIDKGYCKTCEDVNLKQVSWH